MTHRDDAQKAEEETAFRFSEGFEHSTTLPLLLAELVTVRALVVPVPLLSAPVASSLLALLAGSEWSEAVATGL